MRKAKNELENKKINAEVEKIKAKAEVFKKIIDVRKAQIEIVGKAVSCLSDSLNDPAYEESKSVELEGNISIVPFKPKVKYGNRKIKRVDREWMRHKEKMAAGIRQMLVENNRDTIRGNDF